jgi:small subunit ribosomal protein S8
MSLPDPIGDMLARMRNGYRAGRDVVEMPGSKIKVEITRLLKREGYLKDFTVEGDVKKTLRIYLKYDADHAPLIRGMRRVSRPGLRQYVGASRVPRVLGGMGIAVLSTPQGILTGQEAKKQNVGGEVLCKIW